MRHVLRALLLWTGLCLPQLAHGQAQTIAGRVTGSDDVGIPGVNVIVKGTQTGTSTNADGGYRLDAPGNATLVFSYVGMTSREEAVNGRSTIDIRLAETSRTLADVFVTATSQPVRKIETATAVESIGSRELARLSPVSLPDAIRFTPGVYVQSQAGRSRNSIFIRGFPDVVGNGLGYTSLLYDGLRTFASPEMVPDASFRYDLNIDRIEVVRGSAATLYGRGAAAGAVNVISKVGGDRWQGTVRATLGSNSSDLFGFQTSNSVEPQKQIDVNVNGPLAKNLRLNLGGFLLRDGGFRNNLFPDKGGQVRGNIDYLLPNQNGSIRLTGGYIDLDVQNQIDIPYLANDFSKPAPGWNSRDVFMPRGVFENPDGTQKNATLTYPDNTTETIGMRDVTARGNFSKGGNIGLRIDLPLGNGFRVLNNARYQDMTVGIGFDFGLSTLFGPSSSTANPGEVYVTRALFGGGNTGGGSNAKDFINEFRLTKSLAEGNTKHNLTLGYYFSTINVKVASRGVLYALDARSAANNRQVGYRLSPTLALPQIPSLFRNGDYTETVNSVFGGDEMKVNERLTINVGARYDWIAMDLKEDRYAYQRNVTRNPRHQDWSGSVGVNYLIDPNTAIYANVVRAYRAPDYGAYTTVQLAYIDRNDATRTPRLLNPTAPTYPRNPADVITTDAQGRTLYLNPYIDQNEIIYSVEGGFRKSFGDFSFDGGIFYNTIYNRLVSTFIGALAVSVPGGDNRLFGSELSLVYTPQSLKGLFARTSFTYQDATYTRLIQEVSATRKIDVAGNKTANVPRVIWNLSVGYENRRFGANINNNYLGARPADPHNTVDYPAYSLLDANAYVNFPIAKNNIRLKAGVYNLTNTQTAGNIISAVTDNYLLTAKEANFSGTASQVRGVPVIPRRTTISVEYSF